ncbi:hypothetical protein [Variovorax ginsengisoli]|uniref:DUF5666 domain-containing protein n=1 Tax=Variovorax ginsengisoli TaxID=363844 RepID=A0ABT8SD84_9BURK|nr:hypothetical protein [Variovorax ginsengisoli]MDN8617218.1 hypothetical protein [Variovorax ginsengisoli]MDO1536388.1 hypothetical protein [Variovorax ginsengisoli]
MNTKRLILGACAFLPLLAIAGELPANTQVGITLSVGQSGKAMKQQSAIVTRGSETRLGGTPVEYIRESNVDAQGQALAVKGTIFEGLSVIVSPIAILDDRVVVRVAVQERHVIKIDKLTIQGQTVDLPRTTLREASLGNTILTYGSALDVPLDDLNSPTKYQLRLQAERP